MNRHFYISNDLNDLEQIELELEQEGISAAHSHVLSLDDAEVAAHPSLNEVEAVLRTDVVHSTKVGAVVGVVAATSMIYIVSLMGWADKATWVPFVFLAIACWASLPGSLVLLAFNVKTIDLRALKRHLSEESIFSLWI